jgi:hypothetical protein
MRPSVLARFIRDWHNDGMKPPAFLAIAAAMLSACTTVQASGESGVTARLGQAVRVDGPRVTPLTVLEDSRCPMEARCVRAGELRIRVLICTGSRSERREMSLGTPIPVADGTLTLVNVMPPRHTAGPTRPSDYRFTFTFAGGL